MSMHPSPQSRFPARSPDRSRRRAGVAAAAVVTLAAAAAGAIATSGVAAPGVPPASVVGSAAKGGKVIVVLKNQHSNLNLRTQGAALGGGACRPGPAGRRHPGAWRCRDHSTRQRQRDRRDAPRR